MASLCISCSQTYLINRKKEPSVIGASGRGIKIAKRMDWFRSSVPAVKLIRTNSTSSQNDSDRENILETVTESIRDHPSSPFLREFSNYATRADRGMVGTEGKVVKSNLEKRDDLTCVLCGELYADPRLLPCLHSFCRRCLEHTINPRSTQLTCHLCRKEVTMKVRLALSYE